MQRQETKGRRDERCGTSKDRRTEGEEINDKRLKSAVSEGGSTTSMSDEGRRRKDGEGEGRSHAELEETEDKQRKINNADEGGRRQDTKTEKNETQFRDEKERRTREKKIQAEKNQDEIQHCTKHSNACNAKPSHAGNLLVPRRSAEVATGPLCPLRSCEISVV